MTKRSFSDWIDRIGETLERGLSYVGVNAGSGPRRGEVVVNYAKYKNLLKSLRSTSEQVTFTERDPRVNFLMGANRKNIYYIQFILAKEAVEDGLNHRLVLRSDIERGVRDEFERNEALREFEESLGNQLSLLRKKNFYLEMDLRIPEFDFDRNAIEFDFQGLLSNRSIALQDIKFIWDVNMRGFHPRFLFQFDDPETGRQWKQRVSGMRLGMVFNVVTSTPVLWDTGMPATICYVVGFGFINRDGSVEETPPGTIFAQRGPQETIPKNRAQILEMVEKQIAGR